MEDLQQIEQEIKRWQSLSAAAELVPEDGDENIARKLGLLDGEFSLICQKIGRRPSFTELCMFSGMWSEHCSYKNSILLLKTLYSKSDRLLAKPGEENAGALRISEKKAVVFKIESHNHPSALEPYQGAATGVGGIMRDIFTMGARPLMSLNSLRFGHPGIARNKYLFAQAVKGIGDYGNSLGIACGAGEVFFHERFNGNPLVNAMTVGIADIDKMASNSAKYPDNLVVYVGAKTGRDGIHGASFASKELSEESSEERSAVQVGDPFMEKLVMEATLECLAGRKVLAIQDMGAAGLLSSSSEMSAAGDIGMDLHLEHVPAREENMQPFEFLLSESQERMLLVVAKENFEAIKAVFHKWKLSCSVIGITTNTKRLRIFHREKLYADLPAKALTVNSEGAPRYQREIQKPAALENPRRVSDLDFISSDFENNAKAVIEKKLAEFVAQVNLCSKHRIYEQFDTDIGINRLLGPGQNSGVHRVPETDLGIAATVDCNSLYIQNDPFRGTQLAVCEGVRNVVSSGATPIGITNCLNFANPFKPENYFYFSQAIAGMSQAAEFFTMPVTGGNVSLYNETNGVPVLPTPTIGTVGLIQDYRQTLRTLVMEPCEVFFVGQFKPVLESSQLAYFLKKENHGIVPEVNLAAEKAAMEFILAANQKQLLHACHDLSVGGLFLALLKLANYPKTTLAFEIDLEAFLTSFSLTEASLDLALFGETAAGYLIAVAEPCRKVFEDFRQNFSFSEIRAVPLGRITKSDKIEIGFQKKKQNLEARAIFSSFQHGLDDYI